MLNIASRKSISSIAAVLASLSAAVLLSGCLAHQGEYLVSDASVASGQQVSGSSTIYAEDIGPDPVSLYPETAVHRAARAASYYPETPVHAAARAASSSYETQSVSYYTNDPIEVAAAPDEEQPYLLDAGDQVRVFVYGQPNLSRVYPIDGGGFISVPLIGSVKARAMTTYELQRQIAAELRVKYVRDPQVNVEVAAYRPFFILGEVRSPGQYSFVSGMTAQTAVAIAGGYTERAYERNVKISRRINGGIETTTVDPLQLVRPGDTIYVEERFF